MYFPVAGIETEWWLPPLVAAALSFVTSTGGVSGAFLLLPFQMSVLGYVAPSVSATNQLFNVVAVPSGVVRFIKEGRMLWPLAAAVTLGTVPGVFVGILCRVYFLPNPDHFKLFAALVLLFIGGRLIWDLKKTRGREQDARKAEERFAAMRSGTITLVTISFRVVVIRFAGEIFTFSFRGVLLLSMVMGVVAGTYGIGGGAILAPIFAVFYRLPVYIVAGAALLGTLITSCFGVLFAVAIQPLFATMSIAPDFCLGALFGAGGMVGIYLGALFQKRIKAVLIKWMLTGVVLFTALRYLATALS